MMKMEKRKKLVLIDNGHGVETPGKRSPDGCHREYLWCREIAVRLGRALGEAGIEAALLVPELADVSLAVRCARAASLVRGRDAVLVSVRSGGVLVVGRYLWGRMRRPPRSAWLRCSMPMPGPKTYSAIAAHRLRAIGLPIWLYAATHPVRLY